MTYVCLSRSVLLALSGQFVKCSSSMMMENVFHICPQLLNCFDSDMVHN